MFMFIFFCLVACEISYVGPPQLEQIGAERLVDSSFYLQQFVLPTCVICAGYIFMVSSSIILINSQTHLS